MIELVITACIVAQPESCQDQRVLLDQDTSAWQCVMNAQPTIAQWGAEHPKWFVQSWKCQLPKKGAKDI
jgi:hypothetical protein